MLGGVAERAGARRSDVQIAGRAADDPHLLRRRREGGWGISIGKPPPVSSGYARSRATEMLMRIRAVRQNGSGDLTGPVAHGRSRVKAVLDGRVTLQLWMKPIAMCARSAVHPVESGANAQRVVALLHCSEAAAILSRRLLPHRFPNCPAFPSHHDSHQACGPSGQTVLFVRALREASGLDARCTE